MEKNKYSTADFIKSINKMVPKGQDSRVLDNNKQRSRVRFRTGSIALDIALGGGHVKGKMSEFYGINQSSKTSTCLEGVAQFQKRFPEELVLLIDLEDVYDPSYCKMLGIDTDPSRFIVAQPRSGEEAFEYMIEFSKNVDGGLIVVDSISMLLPAKEDEQDMGAHQMGSQAKLMSQGLRKLQPHTSLNGTTMFWINQTRDTFDQYKPVATSGGKAMGFFARTRLFLNKVKGDDPDNLYGYTVKLEKATYAAKSEGETVRLHRIKRGKFAYIRELLLESEIAGIIERSGAWYSYGETKIGNGAKASCEMLEDNPELVAELDKKLLLHYGIEE